MATKTVFVVTKKNKETGKIIGYFADADEKLALHVGTGKEMLKSTTREALKKRGITVVEGADAKAFNSELSLGQREELGLEDKSAKAKTKPKVSDEDHEYIINYKIYLGKRIEQGQQLSKSKTLAIAKKAFEHWLDNNYNGKPYEYYIASIDGKEIKEDKRKVIKFPAEQEPPAQKTKPVKKVIKQEPLMPVEPADTENVIQLINNILGLEAKPYADVLDYVASDLSIGIGNADAIEASKLESMKPETKIEFKDIFLHEGNLEYKLGTKSFFYAKYIDVAIGILDHEKIPWEIYLGKEFDKRKLGIIKFSDKLLVFTPLDHEDKEGFKAKAIQYPVSTYRKVMETSNSILVPMIDYKARKGKIERDYLIRSVLSHYKGDSNKLLADMKDTIAKAPPGTRKKHKIELPTIIPKSEMPVAVHPLPALYSAKIRSQFIEPSRRVSFNKAYDWVIVTKHNKFDYTRHFINQIRDEKQLARFPFKDVDMGALLSNEYAKEVEKNYPGLPVEGIGSSDSSYIPPAKMLEYITPDGFTEEGWEFMKHVLVKKAQEIQDRIKSAKALAKNVANVIAEVDPKSIVATDEYQISIHDLPHGVYGLVDIGVYHGNKWPGERREKDFEVPKSFRAGKYLEHASGKLVKRLKAKETEVNKYLTEVFEDLEDELKILEEIYSVRIKGKRVESS